MPPRLIETIRMGGGTTSSASVYPHTDFSSSATFRQSSSVVRGRMITIAPDSHGRQEQRGQLAERPDDRHVGRAAGDGAAGARDEDGAHAEAARPFDVVDEAVADHDGLGGRGFHRAQRRLEDARVRLHVAVLVRGERDREESLEREVGLERVQAAVRIRDQPDLQAGGVQRPQHAGNVVVHREMMAGGPFGVDVARRGFDPGPGAAHALDDPPRVVDVDLRVVVVDVAARIERGGRRGDGAIERVGIDRDAVARAEVAVAAALERGARDKSG